MEVVAIYKKLKKKDIDKILEYLPYFKDKTNSFYTIENGNFYDPYKYAPKVNQFIELLYQHNFIISFDYPSWQKEAIKYINDPKLLESADLLTLQKLLTLHVRKERFCSGHLAEVIDEGHIVKILERLKEIERNLKE